MKIDFFQVEVPEGYGFSDALEAARQLPDDESRVRQILGVPYRLQVLTHAGGIWEGDMVRIRTEDVPVIVSYEGQVDEVELEDDEGIGEETAFLYNEPTGTMLVQVNRFGVAPSRVVRYFEMVGAIDGAVVPTPVLREDAIHELSRMNVIRSYRVKLAGIKNPELITRASDSVKRTVSLLHNTVVPHVDITMSMGHAKGTLSVKEVMKAAKRFLGLNSGQTVEALQVAGALDGDDHEAVTVDLLNYRMREEADVAPDKTAKRMLYPARKAAIRDALKHRRADLVKQFGG